MEQADSSSPAPADIDSVYFVSGGSEAVESALKRHASISSSGASRNAATSSRAARATGNTLGALATGGNAWRRQQFEP